MANPITKIKGLAARMSSSGKGLGSKDQTTLIVENLRKLADRPSGKVPLVGHLPIEKQYLYTGGTLVVSLLLAAGFTTYGIIKSGNQAHYLDSAGHVSMLTQRLPSLAQQAVQGNPAAFKEFNTGRNEFAKTVMDLRDGDRKSVV